MVLIRWSFPFSFFYCFVQCFTLVLWWAVVPILNFKRSDSSPYSPGSISLSDWFVACKFLKPQKPCPENWWEPLLFMDWALGLFMINTHSWRRNILKPTAQIKPSGPQTPQNHSLKIPKSIDIPLQKHQPETNKSTPIVYWTPKPVCKPTSRACGENNALPLRSQWPLRLLPQGPHQAAPQSEPNGGPFRQRWSDKLKKWIWEGWKPNKKYFWRNKNLSCFLGASGSGVVFLGLLELASGAFISFSQYAF